MVSILGIVILVWGTYLIFWVLGPLWTQLLGASGRPSPQVRLQSYSTDLGLKFAALDVRCTEKHHVRVSTNSGPQHRPQYTMISIVGSCKEGPPIFGNLRVETCCM